MVYKYYLVVTPTYAFQLSLLVSETYASSFPSFIDCDEVKSFQKEVQISNANNFKSILGHPYDFGRTFLLALHARVFY